MKGQDREIRYPGRHGCDEHDAQARQGIAAHSCHSRHSVPQEKITDFPTHHVCLGARHAKEHLSRRP